MNTHSTYEHEQAAAAAFDKQAPLFDAIYSADTIVRYKRKRVRQHLASFLSPASYILELNAGTGDDAIYLARQGHRVHATEISSGMLEMLSAKVKQAGLEKMISHETCSYTRLEGLAQQGPYDHIVSNFAGLNCTDQLEKVLKSFSPLLKPGGHVTLVLLPKFCLWEFMLLFRGKFKTAFRRFTGSKGARAHIEGQYFRCWYYDPSFVRKQLGRSYKVVGMEGLCTIVPPSYIENFAARHPRWYEWLVKKEAKWKTRWPWRNIGDYYVITLQKTT